MDRASGRPPWAALRLTPPQLNLRRRGRHLERNADLSTSFVRPPLNRQRLHPRGAFSILSMAVLLAVGVQAGALSEGWFASHPQPRAQLTGAQLSSATWYAPYVDATLPPEYPSANRSVNPAGQTVFGFIVAARNSTCTPSWGDYYSLSGIDSSTLHLGSVVSAMEAEGEMPIVSFGGENNQPLADTCTTAAALASAYEQVIGTYHLKVLDFDIEGAAQGNTTALARQAQAIKTTQAEAAARGSSLGVWLTIPVAATGMLPAAENVVNAMLNGGVKLSGVNLMTMYFSPSPGNGAPMLGAVEGALDASHAQLGALFARHGIGLSADQVWQHMGATVQIGQAGIANQAFTVKDAEGLVSFAETHALARISDWSANQDAPCGSASNPTVGGYSNYCSGVVETPGQFGQIFSQLTGSPTATPLIGAGGASTPGPSSSIGGSSTGGYREVASDGGVFTFGNAAFHGSVGGQPLNAPVVAMATDPPTGGYWEVASDGGIFAFAAPFYGSMGGRPLNQPIVGLAAMPTGSGYWEVARDGGVFAFGNARFYGSMGGHPLNQPIVGMVATKAGHGYWEVARDGGVFAFGTAQFHGSMGGHPLNAPIVGMATDSVTGGYWEVASDGGLFAFAAPFDGSMGGHPLNAPVVGMAASATGGGYHEVASDGGTFTFGNAQFYGSMGGHPLNAPIVGMATT